MPGPELCAPVSELAELTRGDGLPFLIAAAIVVEDARGIRLSKASRSRQARKIDLAACLVMAHSRATWRATHRKKSKTRSFK